MGNSDCNDVYGIVGDGVVCIDTTGGRGSCNGDSGGPFVQKANAKAAGDKWTRSELSPSEHLLAVRLACLLDSQGPSTTWTGSSRRPECLEDFSPSKRRYCTRIRETI